jgi:PAS domain S-box-containing protein
VERHHRAQEGGRGRSGGPGARRAPARQLTGGDLQLQGNRRLRADVHKQNVKELLGYDREEYLDSPDFWRARVHPEDLSRIEKDYARLFEEGRLANEYRFRKKDGSYCWISDDLQLLRNAAGDPIEVVGAWNDITARKQIGEALVAQDRLVRVLSSRAVIYS